MTASDLIRQVQEDASEWIEMAENPATVVVGVLAHKVIQLTSYIEYLERRLKYDAASNTSRINTGNS